MQVIPVTVFIAIKANPQQNETSEKNGVISACGARAASFHEPATGVNTP